VATIAPDRIRDACFWHPLGCQGASHEAESETGPVRFRPTPDPGRSERSLPLSPSERLRESIRARRRRT
jgi:hypothetical protein